MLNEKIEFYGEKLSMLAIAKKIGITRETLNKYYINREKYHCDISLYFYLHLKYNVR